jgi:hypothetical protein
MKTEASTLKIFFCIGAAKSGTTLLARILDQHPDVACIWESYAFHPRSKASIFNPASDSWRRHGFDEADVQRWASIWRVEPRATIRRALRKLTGRTFLASACYQQTMPAALADFADRCGASIVGDKWPWYVDHLEDVLAVFPEGRYIYNVRDPRGLWNSAQRFRGRQRGDELLRRMLNAERHIAPYLDRPNFASFRYEDLVQQPEAIARRLFEFLGCSFASEYLLYEPADDPYPERWDWVPEAGEQVNPWHAYKWRHQMKPEEVQHVNNLAAWYMEKYGYEH